MPKVAIIDDDDGVIEAMEAAFQFWGFESICVKDAQRTTQILLQEQPDIIFLDLLLSGVDGSQVAKMIRGQHKLITIPIILMSAHPTAQDVARKIPVNGFLAKPFDLETLKSLIHTHTQMTVS